MNFSLNDYFSRIDYHGSSHCDEKVLVDIHRQQCLHIPFEMLDPHLEIEPNLDPDYIFEKLVRNHRGGGCSQINELLALALTELGFKVKRLMARVLYGNNPGDFPTLAHKIVLVTFNDQKWICDTGFGGTGIVEPIPFILNTVFEQHNEQFKLVVDKQYGYKLQSLIQDKWEDLYAFNLTVYHPQDFIAMNYYNSKNPKMIFVRHCIVSMPTVTGKNILNDLLLKERSPEGTKETEIKNITQYHQVLKNHFNIVLPNHPNFFPEPTNNANSK